MKNSFLLIFISMINVSFCQTKTLYNYNVLKEGDNSYLGISFYNLDTSNGIYSKKSYWNISYHSKFRVYKKDINYVYEYLFYSDGFPVTQNIYDTLKLIYDSTNFTIKLYLSILDYKIEDKQYERVRYVNDSVNVIKHKLKLTNKYKCRKFMKWYGKKDIILFQLNFILFDKNMKLSFTPPIGILSTNIKRNDDYFVSFENREQKILNSLFSCLCDDGSVVKW